MTPRLPRARSGITLTEILIAILIMGVGMISLAVLFPIGLLRLQAAARLSRGTFLAKSAGNDLATRNLLSPQSFTSPLTTPWYNLDQTRAGWANSTIYYTPAVYNPWVQDTPFYQGDPTAGGVSADAAQGLPVAYDPLWRYQTAGGYYPAPIGGTAPFGVTATMEGRFASGLGFVRTDPDNGPPSAHGLQRVTNFNPALFAPAVSAVNNPVPEIFVSPEDIVFQEDDSAAGNTSTGSPIVPNMNVPANDASGAPVQPSGLPTNDWRFSWFFTGQQLARGNNIQFEGEVVICENREFNIESVMGPASGTAVPKVAGETVVEAIYGFGSRVVTFPNPGNGTWGFAAGADNTVLLRWPSAMEDPEVKVGGWFADVTYERVAAVSTSRKGDALAAAPPSLNKIFTIRPPQRCHWYQIAKKSPADADALGVAGWRSMTVWTVSPVQEQTLLNPSTAPPTPVHVNAALIMPSVVHVYRRTFTP